MGIAERALDELPIAVVDLETTGFSPKAGARVVELAVVRADPGSAPRIVLDTLINPEGPVHATDVHGITDDDVGDAPFFAEMTDEFVESVRGAVVVAYNAAFDLSFIENEMSRAHVTWAPLPFVCLMYLRPLLEVGRRCDLVTACDEVGLVVGAHQAADDAFASAWLWQAYRDAALEFGVRRFGDLTKLKRYKFTQSFEYSPIETSLPTTRGTAPKPRTNPFALQSPNPWPPRLTLGLSPTEGGVVSTGTRSISVPRLITRQSSRRIYWNALVDAVDDLHASSSDVEYLSILRDRYALEVNEIRALHGRLFADRVREATADEIVTDEEVDRLERLASALAALGWCPGTSSNPELLPDQRRDDLGVIQTATH